MDKLLIMFSDAVGVYLSAGTFYSMGEMELKIGKRVASINMRDSDLHRIYKNIVAISYCIKQMHDNKLYHIPKLKIYYNLIDYYSVIFGINLISLAYELIPVIEKSYAEDNISKYELNAYKRQIAEALTSVEFCDNITETVTYIFGVYDITYKHIDLSTTLRRYIHHATTPVFVDNELDVEESIEIPTKDKSLALFLVKRSSLSVWDTSESYYVQTNVFGELVMYYTNGKTVRIKYEELIRRLYTFDRELCNSIKLDSKAIPLIVLERVLKILRIEVDKLI